MRETGERMGISRERVRQIQANALSRLRNFEEIDELGSYVEACHDAA
ncbi:MAG: sigma factor-like helix-turn-helix DNA-binding protein [Myxococcota bacterium]